MRFVFVIKDMGRLLTKCRQREHEHKSDGLQVEKRKLPLVG